jgi:CRP-like cAMP-binding protein
LLSGIDAVESLIALGRGRVFILGKREFTGALDDCPAFRDAILRSLSRRLAGADRISRGERRLSLV